MEKITSNNFTWGFELEGHISQDLKDILETERDNGKFNDLELKGDGSVSVNDRIIDPAYYEYNSDSYIIEETAIGVFDNLETLKKYLRLFKNGVNYESNKTCGLHIHLKPKEKNEHLKGMIFDKEFITKLENYSKLLCEHNEIKSDIISDSNLLFREFIKNGIFEKDILDINRVNKIVKSKTFWGRLLFINTETKQNYYFGDFFLSALNKNILVVSTKALEKDKVSLYGMEFEGDNKDIIESKIEGIFRIDAKKQEFKKYKLEFNKIDYSKDIKSEFDDYNYGYNYGGGAYKNKKWGDRNNQGSFAKLL